MMSTAISRHQIQSRTCRGPNRRNATQRLRQQPVTVARALNLKKSYGNVVALENLNLDIHAGELLALLGPNGAGKTTLVACCWA